MNNVTIILGVNGDLGNALAAQYLENQQEVIGVDLHAQSSDTRLSDYFSADLRQSDQLQALLTHLESHVNKNLTLISCVGKFGEATYLDNHFNEKLFMESLSVNLIGVSLFVNQLLSLRLNRSHQKTRIVVVGSAAAQVGSLDIGYGVAKAGLNGLVRSISKSLSSKGVTCIGVNPGIFESHMSRQVTKERQDRAINATHIKRIGLLKEVADFIYYIANEAPDYLTGSIIPINGGQL